MRLDQIKELIKGPTYDFLRTDEHLGNRIMLLTLGGSHAYGTDIETSDVDVRGFFGEGPREIIGLSNYDQFENKPTDTTIYSFRKIVGLMLNCNPNTIEILGSKPEQIFVLSKEGKMLKDNLHLFLSKKAQHSFGGYANSQLRRLQNALARDSYPQTEKERHIMGSIENQIFHLQQHYTAFDDGAFTLYLDDSDKEGYEKEIFMDINMKHYPLRDFRNIYSEMTNVVNDYDKLNKRNRKKDELHLLKHAMHLVRLFLMGTEILEGKGVNTYRENDREFLLDIRNGKYTYDQLFEIVDEYERKFNYAVLHSPLPASPDYRKVEELVMEINKSLLRNYYCL